MAARSEPERLLREGRRAVVSVLGVFALCLVIYGVYYGVRLAMREGAEGGRRSRSLNARACRATATRSSRGGFQ